MRTFLLVLALLASSAAFAVEPDEVLDDPALEARARVIDAQLRCVVCQSQSISESNAPLAKDLRLLVRERLVEGDTDQQAIEYIVARYGDYVLLKPRLRSDTVFLWVFPAFILLAGLAAAGVYLRGRPQAPLAPLDDEDEEELRRIMEERG